MRTYEKPFSRLEVPFIHDTRENRILCSRAAPNEKKEQLHTTVLTRVERVLVPTGVVATIAAQYIVFLLVALFEDTGTTAKRPTKLVAAVTSVRP
jgi:hypothetical protein